MSANLTHLRQLEAESIHIMREVASEFSNPVMLYSIGKDSSVMLHLARKAFHPGVPPFPLMHVDTTWKFREMYAFRESVVQDSGMELIVHINEEGLAKGINPFSSGSQVHTDIMKTEGLKQVTDTGAIETAVDEIIAANPDQVAKAQQNPKLAGWFVGQVMKATGGKANPKAVNEIVSRKLAQQ